MSELVTKSDLLAKLGAYSTVQDDESVQYKTKIKKALIKIIFSPLQKY